MVLIYDKKLDEKLQSNDYSNIKKEIVINDLILTGVRNLFLDTNKKNDFSMVLLMYDCVTDDGVLCLEIPFKYNPEEYKNIYDISESLTPRCIGLRDDVPKLIAATPFKVSSDGTYTIFTKFYLNENSTYSVTLSKKLFMMVSYDISKMITENVAKPLSDTSNSEIIHSIDINKKNDIIEENIFTCFEPIITYIPRKKLFQNDFSIMIKGIVNHDVTMSITMNITKEEHNNLNIKNINHTDDIDYFISYAGTCKNKRNYLVEYEHFNYSYLSCIKNTHTKKTTSNIIYMTGILCFEFNDKKQTTNLKILNMYTENGYLLLMDNINKYLFKE